MKRAIVAAVVICLGLALAGCGSDSRPAYVTQILSDPIYDGYIEETAPSTYSVTQGMSPTVQSVFAGIDPVSLNTTRAFLDFPLGGSGGIPLNAVIASAFLDIYILNTQPQPASIPIRIELVDFQPPNLTGAVFDRTLQPPLAFTTIIPPIDQTDIGHHVIIDVTDLMVEAQRQGLQDFQVRILEDVGAASPGLIEISDTTGGSRSQLAPLLEVTYY